MSLTLLASKRTERVESDVLRYHTLPPPFATAHHTPVRNLAPERRTRLRSSPTLPDTGSPPGRKSATSRYMLQSFHTCYDPSTQPTPSNDTTQRTTPAHPDLSPIAAQAAIALLYDTTSGCIVSRASRLVISLKMSRARSPRPPRRNTFIMPLYVTTSGLTPRPSIHATISSAACHRGVFPAGVSPTEEFASGWEGDASSSAPCRRCSKAREWRCRFTVTRGSGKVGKAGDMTGRHAGVLCRKTSPKIDPQAPPKIVRFHRNRGTVAHRVLLQTHQNLQETNLPTT